MKKLKFSQNYSQNRDFQSHSLPNLLGHP